MANHLDLEEQEQLDQLKHFWRTWGTLISIGIIVVAGSFAAWNGYQFWQNRQASQAASLFDVVDVAVQQGSEARFTQAFVDLKSQYPGTTQASQAGLLVSKSAFTSNATDVAKDALGWTVENSSDEGLKALARLRLASVLIDQMKLDDAMSQLSGNFPVYFEALVSDRRGDVLVLQDKKADAITHYQKALAALDSEVEYRRLIEIKLASLGVAAVPGRTDVASVRREAK